MKLSEFVILFLGIFIILVTIAFYNVDVESKANIIENEYNNKLTAACEDAIKVINPEDIDKGHVWGDYTKRKQSVDAFFTTLQMSFNNANNEDLRYAVPIICLIDLDGYYLAYNSIFDDKSLSERNDDEGIGSLTTMSNINTWSKEYDGDTIIRYFLSDIVEITTPNNIVLKGDITTVWKDLVAKEGTSFTNTHVDVMNILGSYETFDLERNKVIIQNINDNVIYYINHANINAQGYDIPYEYDMPTISDQDYHRLLQRPSCIGFLQGIQTQTKNNFINIYSLAGGELIKQQRYFITDDGSGHLTYHKLYVNPDGSDICDQLVLELHHDIHNINMVNGQDDVSYTEDYYTVNGNPLIRIFPNAESCAELGAQPCGDCVY